MKITSLVMILCLLPAIALSHPGKTDRYGGHQCLKGCEAWGLFYKEYHLHDKDGKPVRITRNKKANETIEKELPKSVETGTAIVAVVMLPENPKTEVVTTYRYVTNVYEENIFFANPYLSILLILLLVLLILSSSRRRGSEKGSGRY